MTDRNTYDVFITPRRLDREKLGIRELKFQVDMRDPWARAHYGSNAQEIGTTIRSELLDSAIVVQNTAGSEDVFRIGYVIEVGENAGGDDKPDDWPPTWFVHAWSESGVGGHLEDILRDILPDGWDYHIDEELDFTLTCPHGHIIEPDADCPDGCSNPLTKWCKAQRTKK